MAPILSRDRDRCLTSIFFLTLPLADGEGAGETLPLAAYAIHPQPISLTECLEMFLDLYAIGTGRHSSSAPSGVYPTTACGMMRDGRHSGYALKRAVEIETNRQYKDPKMGHSQ